MVSEHVSLGQSVSNIFSPGLTPISLGLHPKTFIISIIRTDGNFV